MDRVKAKAEAEGRAIRFGMRLHVITRESEGEAWAEAERLLDTMDPALIDAAQQLLQKSESVGQQRMRSLHNGNREDLEVSPNLWAGIGRVPPGAGTALVGNHEPVAARLEHHSRSTSSSCPGILTSKEVYAVGEGVLPRGRGRPRSAFKRGLSKDRRVAAPARSVR
jgi:alkanesulfonate monooxygenase